MRNFYHVAPEYRMNKEIPTLPTRADEESAGYDFYSPKTIGLLPKQRLIIWTDIKAKMQHNDFLQINIRSSLAIKHKITLTNCTGIIDASYYNNLETGGNIGISLFNTSDNIYIIQEGDRIAQGIFLQYYTTSIDRIAGTVRTGGIGSSGK